MADDLTLRSATELSGMIARSEVSPVELTEAFIARAKRFERFERVHHARRGGRAARRPGGGSGTVARHGAGPAARASRRGEGPVRRQGDADDARRQHRGLRRGRGRHGGRTAPRRRRRATGQAEPERVRAGRQRAAPVRRSAQPVGRDATSRTVEQRLRRRCRGVAVRGCARWRHGGLDTRPGGVVRHRGAAPDVGRGQPPRRVPDGVVHGHDRSDDQDGRRHRDAPPVDRGPRPEGPLLVDAHRDAVRTGRRTGRAAHRRRAREHRQRHGERRGCSRARSRDAGAGGRGGEGGRRIAAALRARGGSSRTRCRTWRRRTRTGSGCARRRRSTISRRAAG